MGIILIMVTTYVTAQMVASGKALSSFVGIDYRTGVVVGAVIIIGYTFVGGYKAGSYTDVVHGVEGEAGMPAGSSLDDYDALVVGGSGLRCDRPPGGSVAQTDRDPCRRAMPESGSSHGRIPAEPALLQPGS